MRNRNLGLVIACLIVLSIAAVDATFTALCGTGVSCAYVAGDKFGYQTVEKIRQNFNHLIAPQYWTGASDSGLTAEKNLGALSTGLVINTAGTPSAYTGATCSAGSTVTAVSASGALTCGITPSSASSTDTLTNKTLNAESTGNVVTLPFTIYWPAAVCDQAGVYAPLWTTNATNNPSYSSCWGGTNNQGAGLDFLDSETEYAYQQLPLPTDWSGAIDMRIFWRSTATTGNVVWQVQTACVADGESIDPTWNTAQTVTDATQGTASRRNTATLTSVTTTGCAAGETLFFRLLRDPAHASDTISATAEFDGLELTYRRAM